MFTSCRSCHLWKSPNHEAITGIYIAEHLVPSPQRPLAWYIHLLTHFRREAFLSLSLSLSFKEDIFTEGCYFRCHRISAHFEDIEHRSPGEELSSIVNHETDGFRRCKESFKVNCFSSETQKRFYDLNLVVFIYLNQQILQDYLC